MTAPRRTPPWAAPAFAVAAFAAVWLFLAAHPLLYDADSYYHLAIARVYAGEGIVDELPQARFNQMRDGFGDPALLFHLVLAPFAAAADPLAGGRTALAMLIALVLTAVGALSARAAGPWGYLVPLGLIATSTELCWRLVRLRPELLSLLLLLAALGAIGRRRYRLAGLLGALYALAYTAFHAFLGLAALIFLFTGLVRRRWEWALPVYAAFGVGLGLVLHPHFPKNLEIWTDATITYYAVARSMPVGSELMPNRTDVVLLANLGWFAALGVLWAAGRRPAGEPPAAATAEPPPPLEAERSADAFGIAAAAFGGLYLLASRFSIYFYVFATLWLFFELRRRGRLPGARVPLPGGGRIPLAVALAACLVLSLPSAARELARFDRRTDPGPGGVRLADRQALAAAIPEGARVAAPWQMTGIYMLHAPGGRYLNVLDPLGMALPHPERWRIAHALFEAELPDPVLAAAGPLESDYIAFSTAAGPGGLAARLDADPRAEPLHRGIHALWRLVPDANRAFALDWRVLPTGTPPTALAGAGSDAGVPYPRAADGRARRFEGFVDAGRLGLAGSCAVFTRVEERPEPAALDLELAPWGPAGLWLDGQPVASVRGAPGAVLGSGVVVRVALAAGPRQLTVETCPGERGGERANGFYLLAR